MRKYASRGILRCGPLVLAICVLAGRTAAAAAAAAATATSGLRRDDSRSAVPSSNREIRAPWLQRRREESATPRREALSRWRFNADARLLRDDGRSTNLQNTGVEAVDDRSSDGRRNRGKASSQSRGSSRSVVATDRPESRTHRDSILEAESEKLAAVAVAEYTAARAVVYAGYSRHRDRDYDPTRRREILTPGYAIPEESATRAYTKHHAGRRVCGGQVPSSAVHHHHHHHHRSRRYRLLYTAESSSSTFFCCPGWSQLSRTSYGCNRPTCAFACLNGGVCGPHGKCNCPKAFEGSQCQRDVDECVTEKPCDQLCTNLPGGYECHCRHGFHLQPDGQSCRKNGSDGTAFEARDLENDYGYTGASAGATRPRPPTPTPTPTTISREGENEVGEGQSPYDVVLERLSKLEKQMARERRRDDEARINRTIEESVAATGRAIDDLRSMQREMREMREKFERLELESRRLERLTNRVADLETRLRLRCDISING